MSSDFFIEIPVANDTLTHNFGVFSSKVQTPDTFVCTKNDKPFSRFFYVVNGLIIFDKGTKTDTILKCLKTHMIFGSAVRLDISLRFCRNCIKFYTALTTTPCAVIQSKSTR